VAVLQLGRQGEAESEFEKALKYDSSFVPARTNLAQILQRQGDLDAASRHYAAALKLDSSNVFAQQGFADVALEQGDYARAEEHYQKAYSLGAADRQVVSRWALALLQQEKYAEALRVNARLLALEPDNARAHHNQARIYIACDSMQQAERELEIVLRLAPGTEGVEEQLEEIRKVGGL